MAAVLEVFVYSYVIGDVIIYESLTTYPVTQVWAKDWAMHSMNYVNVIKSAHFYEL